MVPYFLFCLFLWLYNTLSGINLSNTFSFTPFLFLLFSIFFIFCLYNCGVKSAGQGSDCRLSLSFSSPEQPTCINVLSISVFWIYMSHVKGKKALPLTKLDFVSLRGSKLTPPTAPTRLFSLFRSNPIDFTKVFSQDYKRTSRMQSDWFFYLLLWNLEHGVTAGGWHNSVVFCCQRTPGCWGDWRNVM